MSNESEIVDELQQPDETRPAKRARLDAALTVTEDTREEMEEDDWDDVYGNAAEAIASKHEATTNATSSGTLEQPTALAQNAPHEHQSEINTMIKGANEIKDGIPAEAIASGDDLVAPPQSSVGNDDLATANVMEETTKVEFQPPSETRATHDKIQDAGVLQAGIQPPEEEPAAQPIDPGSNDLAMLDAHPLPKPTEDVEFMAAAAAQKGNEKAEWQFDSSDAESSSDSDSSDSSDDSSDESDSGSEGGYEMLDPATAAKILMSGDGDDDDGGKGKDKNASDHQPRTANEVKDEIVPKPDVVVTTGMKITYLGNVESVVENMILIKGATPGEYQVLEGGSVLCDEKREVIGAVADTFGRVQEPLYSVSFNNVEEIKQAGLAFGTKVYYVNDHSTFVFTQPLKNMKGTDASNIHDEEIAEDEQEFSDDEAEAEYKRQKKIAKKAGRGGLSRSAFQSSARSFDTSISDATQPFSHGSASDVPNQSYGGGLSYDDDEPAEDFYQPLKRPENLSQMMAGGLPPPRPAPYSTERGRGRGRGDRDRGRGRGGGDRGRGRGGFENRNQRGGRGGSHSHNQQENVPRGGAHQRGNHHRGNAQSFPDRFNGRSEGGPQHALPPKPNVPVPAALPSQIPMPATQPQYQQQTPQTYQFNGYTFQFGNPPPPQQAAAPQNNYFAQQQSPPAGQMPAGAHVNPAFFPQQAQQPQGAQQGYDAWSGQYQQQYQQPQQPQYAQYQAGPSAQQPQQQPPQQQQNSAQPAFNLDLTSILKRLGAQ